MRLALHRSLFLGQLFFLSSFSIGMAAPARPLNKSDAGGIHRPLTAGPAAGVNLTFSSCTSGTVLTSSATGLATYAFGAGDCDGNGFTAISEATGASATSLARVIIGITNGNNTLRFDRNLLSGTAAVFTKAHLKSTAGDAFKLTNLSIFPANTASQTFTVTAYKGGIAISGSTITINYITTTPAHGTTLTSTDFGTNYDDIDEIQATSSTGIGLALDNIQTAAALPVTFTYFNGRTDGSNVLLNWGTAIESNVKNFEIERSTDGSTFLSQGTVDSKAIGGNSVSPLDYNYTDILNGLPPAALFYRLKESDLDGRLNYSPILKMNAPGTNISLSIYPNPFRQQVTITVGSPFADKAVITVTDLSGRKVLEQVTSLQKGSNILPLSTLSQLGKGMYLFTIATGQQKQTIGLIKLE